MSSEEEPRAAACAPAEVLAVDADAGVVASVEEASAAALVDDGESEEPIPGAPDHKIPWYMKLYGWLCLLQGALALASVVVLVVVIVALFGLGGTDAVGSVVRQASDAVVADAGEISTMTLILTICSALSSLLTAVALFVFGLALLRNRRRRAAEFAYALIALTVANLLLAIMLEGIGGADMVRNLVQLAILVAISVTVDPTLSEERQLQRKLRDMELREDVEQGTLGRDETGKGYISLDFFNLFWTFVVCCVLGLVIEVVFHMIVVEPGVYQDRAGMLYGPFSPIYGFGAVLMTCALNRFWNKNVVLIFIVSALIGGAFEVFVSWFMQTAFGATAWDYTGYTIFGLPDPIAAATGGRTSAMFAAMWGLLGVVWIKFILPFMLKLINLIPWKWRYSVTTVCTALMLIDGLMTLQSLDCWYEREAGHEPSTPVEQFYAQHYDDAYMANRFQSMSINVDDAARIPDAADPLAA